MNITVNTLNADLIFEYLDKSEGGKNTGDEKLGATIWNDFIDKTGIKGRKISYAILKDRTETTYGALVSLSSYLKKSDEITKQKIVDYLNAIEKDFQTKNTGNTQTDITQKSNDIFKNPEVTYVQAHKEQEKKVQSKQPVQNNVKITSSVEQDDFSERTKLLNSQKFYHTTILLDVAQDSLGIKEVSRREFEKLSDEEKAKTQYAMIGNYGDITDQWCAHTVSTLCAKAGIAIGVHKSSVQGFINWARNKGTYKPITTVGMNSNNLYAERQKRADQLREQFASIHEGDFIIMKSQYVARTSNAGDVSRKASHIMIAEDIDVKNGIITVIEGNANENCYIDSERVLVKNSAEGRNGNQTINEFQEINKRDGLIRKRYTIEELVACGYSGYIDNTSIT